jgi:hypothetical protein
MRENELDPVSSLFASLSYAFSGIFLSTGNTIITLSTATWTPILLLFYLRSLRRESIKYALLSGMIIAIQFLSGTPDYLCLDLILLFLLTMSWTIHKKGYFPIKSFMVVGLSGIGLSLFQLLPFLEFVFLSDRMGGLSFPVVSMWSLELYEILCIFIPLGTSLPSEGYIFPYIGQKMTTSLYIGILPLIIVISTPFWKDRRFLWFWTGITIFSLCLAAGKHLPVYSFFYKYLPGFSMFRNPVKAMHLFSLSASILAGFSFNKLFSKDITKRLILFSFLYIFLYLLFDYTNISFEIGSRLKLYLSRWATLEEAFLWKHFIALNCLKVSIILLGYSLLIYLICKGKIERTFGLSCIIILTIFDLSTFNGRLNYLINEDFYRDKPKIARNLSNGRFLGDLTEKMVRYMGASTYEDFILSKEVLYGNMGMVFGLYNAGGYEGIYLKDFMFLAENVPSKVLIKIMDVQNILYYEDGKVISNKNLDSLPRAFFVKEKMVLDRKGILEYMKSPSFCPEKEVILEEEPKEMKNVKCKMKNIKCKITEYEPNRVVIDVDVPSNGFLFLSDTYYPGWKAYVDGKETKIYKANYCFRAVQVEKGRHKVEFSYLPGVFIIGLIGTVISIVIILLFIILPNKTKLHLLSKDPDDGIP